MEKTYLTAESVCAEHPDKLCDFIADSILDACLRKDRSSHVACKVLATKEKIIVAGGWTIIVMHDSYLVVSLNYIASLLRFLSLC